MTCTLHDATRQLGKIGGAGVTAADDIVDSLQEGLVLRAPAMIVTIYGDVVVPRGGVLWMGTLVSVCARFGISETLVRTAVSRLMASGRLVGERHGRRSYYRLAEAARAEFDAASRLLFGPFNPATHWTIHAADLPEDVVRQSKLGHLSTGVYLRASRPNDAPLEGLSFSAMPIGDSEGLVALAARLWDVGGLADGYAGMLSRFKPVEAIAAELPPADALAVRLLLVHVYRAVLLRDPGLPAAALPEDWPGSAAHQLFASLYVALSPAADRQIGAEMEGQDGTLPAGTDETASRLRALKGF